MNIGACYTRVVGSE